MSDAKERRNRTTVLYVVLSAAVLFFGIGLTIWGGRDVPLEMDANGKITKSAQESPTAFSVGTSLLAAGLASLGFAVVRVFDDRDTTKLNEELQSINGRFDGVNAALIEARGLLRRSRIVLPTAQERCLFDPQISNRFREAIDDCVEGHDLQIDVVGLKLHRFLSDQLVHIAALGATRSVNVRMLLQNPDSADFNSICNLETRDEKGTKNDILAALRRLKGANQIGDDLIYKINGLTISVRFYPWFQPIAFFRVNDTILVRPRIRSSGAGSRFYEAYYREEGQEYFGLYKDHFEDSWAKGRFEVPASIAHGMRGLFNS